MVSLYVGNLAFSFKQNYYVHYNFGSKSQNMYTALEQSTNYNFENKLHLLFLTMYTVKRINPIACCCQFSPLLLQAEG